MDSFTIWLGTHYIEEAILPKGFIRYLVHRGIEHVKDRFRNKDPEVKAQNDFHARMDAKRSEMAHAAATRDLTPARNKMARELYVSKSAVRKIAKRHPETIESVPIHLSHLVKAKSKSKSSGLKTLKLGQAAAKQVEQGRSNVEFRVKARLKK